MRYKFDLAPAVKSTVEWQLRYYKEDKRQLETLWKDMIPSPTPGYSQTGGVSGGTVGRDTEDVTIKIISSPYIRRIELTCSGIERAINQMDDTDKKLIDLIYWRAEYTVEGAGMKIGLSKSAAYQRVNKILGTIAYELGYVSM